MSVLDQSIAVGKEGASAYGTAVAPTRGYEATADGWTAEIEQIVSDGLRAGRHTILSSRRRPIDLGSSGSLELPITKTGIGLLLEGTLGTASIAQVASTTAWVQKFATRTDQADPSYTVQIVRVDSENNERTFIHTGATCTGGNISISQGGAATMRWDYSAQGEDVIASPTAPVYGTAADNDVFIFSDATLKVNNVVTASITDFSLDFDFALNTTRRFLRGSARRARPLRNGSPSFSGTMSAEFTNLDIYNLFKDGTTFPVELTLEIDDETIATDSGIDYKPRLTIKMPACRFDGSSPSASVNELTTLDAPFVALYGGTDPAVSFEYVSTDVTH